MNFDDAINPFVFDASFEMDPTRMLRDTTDTELTDFFKRPIKIHHLNWTLASSVNLYINPWELYFSNPRVINRLNNYNLLRCKLHVKVVVNGNAFYYGRMLVAYSPFGEVDNFNPYSNPLNITSTTLSQRPKIFVDPCTSAGGDLILPFFSTTDYVSIPDSGISQLGILSYRSFGVLKNANAADEPISVCTFAWLEDVQYSIPTAQDSTSLVPQSGEVEEGSATGIVSGPASTVAHAAGMLSQLPIIGKYAAATRSIASTVGALAKLFGFSRPPNISNPTLLEPRTTSSYAVCDAPDNVSKLTIDSKQELSVDPRIAGVDNVDTLSIRSIAGRESYITSFTWAVTSGPETLLWNARVNPLTYADGHIPSSYSLSACAVAALPFKFWTGSLRYRFQLVSSAYHRGRIRVVFDPYDTPTTPEYNVNYTQIVDVASESDFTIEIGPGQERTLMRRFDLLPTAQLYSTSPLAKLSQMHNGTISVFVVNELTTPNTTVNNDIIVNVYISAADDFEVFVPAEDYLQNMTYFPEAPALVAQSGIMERDGTSSYNTPQRSTTYTLGTVRQDNSNLPHVFIGESVSSMRQLLKRYNHWRSFSVAQPGAGVVPNILRVVMNWYPFHRGYTPLAVDSSVSGPYNYSQFLLLHLIQPCFAGFRGGLRYKWTADRLFSNCGGALLASRYLTNLPYSETLQNNSTTTANTFHSIMVNGDTRPHGHNGMALNHNAVNPSLELEYPYYSNERFHLRYEEWEGTASNMIMKVWLPGSTSGVNTYDCYVAVAEDFQTYFWVGLPDINFVDNNPAPT